MMKKMFKKSVALCLSGIMVFSMVGCSGDDDSETSSDGVVTLKIQENETAKKQGYLDELINAFNEAYKDKGIQAVDANGKEYVDLAKDGPDGWGPDIVFQANDYVMKYADDQIIMNLNPEDFECYDKTDSSAWDAFKIIKDGETYYCGVPVNIQEPMLFYCTDYLPDDWETEWDDNSNGTPDFFENWNDMYAVSKEINEEDSSKYGYMAPVKDVYFSSGFLFSYGAYVFGTNEDGSINAEDIGFSKNDAELGANVVRQLASVMNEQCSDDSIKTNRYENVANGTYLCAVSTPDTYTLFTDKLELIYEGEGMTADEASAAAEENLKMIQMPSLLPADGDLTTDSSTMSDSDWVESIQMGGVSGYGISSFSEHYDECVEFINFATSYDMLLKRANELGLACTRSDVAEATGDFTKDILANLASGQIYLMPSCKQVGSIWKSGETFFSDIALDPFRDLKGEDFKYTTLDSMKAGLETVDDNIYKAIYSLSGDEESDTTSAE